MAKQPNTDAAKAVADAQAEAVRLQEERDKATPTPTQEELDRINRGEQDLDGLKADGSTEEAAAAAPATNRTGAVSQNRQVKTD